MAVAGWRCIGSKSSVGGRRIIQVIRGLNNGGGANEPFYNRELDSPGEESKSGSSAIFRGKRAAEAIVTALEELHFE